LVEEDQGQAVHFGRWGRVVEGKLTRLEGDTWKDALEAYQVQRDDLQAGRTPRGNDAKGLTVATLANHFLTAKTRKKESGELSPRMFDEYKAVTDRLIADFGKERLVDDLAADDFGSLRADLAKRYGPTRLGNLVQMVRTVFKHGTDNGLIEKAIRYGSEFKKPSKSVMRRHRAESGKRTFEPAELRKLIEAAGVPLKAMILLGVNAAYGNNDCGRLPLSALDLESGWATFHRPKTGIARRAKLWPQTVEAIKAAIAERPEPRESAKGLVFVTKYGGPWSNDGGSTAVTHETSKLLASVGLTRPGLNFYSLRHTFRTVADAAKDTNAVRMVMGHTDASIDANYTHGIDDDRLEAVADHVRKWVFGE
jgi:integrase